MDAFIGEIRAFANNYYPEGWLPCTGQQISIQQYQALYAVIGTLYGNSDGRTYFTVPNLQGVSLVGAGRNPAGQLDLNLGESTGAEGFALIASELPAHNHTFTGAIGATTARISTADNRTSFVSNFAINPTSGGPSTSALGYVATAPTPVFLNLNTIASTGGNAQGICDPHENRSPFLVINYYICATDGVFPPRP
jgi:microcystin-dependent protein